jgi:FtsH-binding integral membrane protein
MFAALWQATMQGALMRCMNLVNLFLSLLNLMGKRRG